MEQVFLVPKVSIVQLNILPAAKEVAKESMKIQSTLANPNFPVINVMSPYIFCLISFSINALANASNNLMLQISNKVEPINVKV